ncbi:tRNA (adenosine(37)-N6)-threonylcarbamoyltransferase complex ATPase subunit type 1 TsaE [Sulfuriroseicoccus oceanibius]|uniref:tRNA threonylcarbamoyladenosine biosynthesis protein TsaE n=1 Tax=Sulfuriroseicoccus oceanibius TaxID=2707525 RepID=A0A6B3L7N9_9BACT|nr:tRNA (adenosine(37)-N6)-threonylcarbamoyltransferase complex ATPase subunit type 1 TsaE [Sulfuriroseicoccus oceanibius]QQL45349.1 tRNA (adenosine(37)-N6)-threonylcarbamoyltransferase complex ATPase subunit type 1 TsaE [Sulfuriroseicoccus oceanibius]
MSFLPNPNEPLSLASIDATRAAAAELAATLKDGDVVALIGTLGAGKTHFSAGLIAALGSDQHASSPTFSLVNVYRDTTPRVSHFDFYRINSEHELLDLGWDDYLDEGGVVIVEWANKFPSMMPPNTQWFELRPVDDSTREIQRLDTAPEAFTDHD